MLTVVAVLPPESHDAGDNMVWNIFHRWWNKKSITGYFIVGLPTEQRGPVGKTPHKQQFPFPYGKVILAMQMTATQYVTVSLKWKDKKSTPAKVQDPQFIVSNSELLAIKNEKHEEVDGGTVSSCEVWAVGPIGTSAVSLIGDADLGEGVKTIRFDGQILIVGGQAVAGTLDFSLPLEQPDEPPPAPPAPPPADTPPTE